MTRIGFAYNKKPHDADPRVVEDDADGSCADDEPPSGGRPRNVARPLERSAWAAPSDTDRPPRPASCPRPPDHFAEWDSEETIAAVECALAGLGEVVRLEATAELPERLRVERPDIVFNMAEGLYGANRESHVPAICEFFGIPYTGSDPFTLSLCLDKARTKECLAFHGVPTAAFALVRSLDDLRTAGGSTRRQPGRVGAGTRQARQLPLRAQSGRDTRFRGMGRRLPLPAFIKPACEGSSKGITERNLCRTTEELDARAAELLERYAQPVLVEQYLPGAEFTCAVLGNGAEAHVLPLVAMNFSALPDGALPVYGFEAKWLWDRPDRPLEIFECPARIDEALRSRIEDVVLHAYRVLGCRDWSRIDVRLDEGGVPNVVEVNPLPGILPNPEDNSCFPKAARAAGMSYDQLIQTCVRFAAERQGIPLPEDTVRDHPVQGHQTGLAPTGVRAADLQRVAATLG